MNKHRFDDVGVGAWVYPPKSPCFVYVREGSLQARATVAEQPSASRSSNSSSITADSFARGVLAFPIPATPHGLRDVSAHAQYREILKQLVTVISFVCDRLLNPSLFGFTFLTFSAAVVSVSLIVSVSPLSAG
jgi:hypothetical protein